MGFNWLLGVNDPLVDTFGFKYGHGGENRGTSKVNNSFQLASWKLKKIKYTNIDMLNTP